MGLAYIKGLGVPQDFGEAVKWWIKAARQGLDGAQYNLGCAYYMGHGVLQDFSEAAYWLRKAAGQGFEPAMRILQIMREKGCI